jgi:hypothetical protein
MKILSGIVVFLLATPVFASSWSSAGFLPNYRLQAQVSGITWTIGDKAGYNVDMGVAQGTMKVSVREKVEGNFWINQELALGSAGDHLIETLINPETGEMLKLIVDGEDKEIPEAAETEIVSTENEEVTVPAGTFPSIHVVSKDVKTGKLSDSWLNETAIPVYGLLKAVEPGDFGKTKIDLTDFAFATQP